MSYSSNISFPRFTIHLYFYLFFIFIFFHFFLFYYIKSHLIYIHSISSHSYNSTVPYLTSLGKAGPTFDLFRTSRVSNFPFPRYRGPCIPCYFFKCRMLCHGKLSLISNRIGFFFSLVLLGSYMNDFFIVNVSCFLSLFYAISGGQRP